MLSNNLFRAFPLLILVVTLSGCRSIGLQQPNPAHPICFRNKTTFSSDAVSPLSAAKQSFQFGLEHEERDSPICIDYFFQTAMLAWSEMDAHAENLSTPSGPASDLYKSALRKIICVGQRLGRFDPQHGLNVQLPEGEILIPVRFLGFPRQPDEFDRIVPVSDYSTKKLNRRYRCEGHGVATVVHHARQPDERFRRNEQVFAATVLLRPNDCQGLDGGKRYVLELFDPLRVASHKTRTRELILERDLTAPFVVRESEEKGNLDLRNFIQRGTTTEGMGLFMLEPYQPGKIPVLFVHGLLSDPSTWSNAANELMARPDLLERYQIWGFEYATGEPFLTSAAILRQQLKQLTSYLDPTGCDPALSEMILISHSMGGLISKLQVSSSGNQLWDSVSCKPFENVAMSSEVQSNLIELFYFEPSARISRAVFIGTPHRGSPTAQRCIAKIGAKLVKTPSTLQEQHRRLIESNPNTFSQEFSKRIPVSIDLLKPDSELLLAIDKLCPDPSVKLHSIYGNGYHMRGAWDSDKVVPVWSAKLKGVSSEKAIHSKHTDLHKNDVGISELFRILKTHMHEYDRTGDYNSRSNDTVTSQATPTLSGMSFLPLQPAPTLQRASPVVEVHPGNLP